jgi:hypothetical protein
VEFNPFFHHIPTYLKAPPIFPAGINILILVGR